MGFSKKKSKNKAKADRRVGPKAKEKAKKHRQIQGREQIKASKRKASEITSSGNSQQRRKGTEDDLDGLDAVDELFADEAFASDDDENAKDEKLEPVSDSEESSAGAFCDVDGDDDGLPQDDLDLEGLEELGSGAKHEEELKAIREKDPEFYKFLVENDRALLDFRAPDEDEEAKDEETEKAEAPQPQPVVAALGRVLTQERFRRLQESSRDSFTAFKAVINAFHLAVRSIEGKQLGAENEEEADADSDKKGKKRKQKDKKKQRQTLIRIDDEGTFSEVLEWSLANMIELFKHFAGELQTNSKQSMTNGKKQKRQKMAEKPADSGESALDPTCYSRWPRVKVLVHIFWEETFFLLNHIVEPQMLEYVLRMASTPEALSWLWPFKGIRQRFLRRCCSLWSNASAHKVRLLAFLFIRNSAAMSLHKADGRDREVPQLETMTKMLIRSFADVAAMGYSWRSLSTFRFMENCLLEMLRLNDASAYRIGYACIRQLALVLRNASVASSQISEKSKKKKSAQMKAMSLAGWPFIRAIYLWTKAVGTVAVLRPLAYPLSMVIMGATKSRLTSLQNYPFVHHCMRNLNELSALLEVFVPVSSYLLKAFNVLLQSMEKSYRKRSIQGGSQALSGSKAPDLEILLRFSEGQVSEILTLEAVGSSICFHLTDHLGLLARSPALPEVAAPVLMHLKRFGKHCKSEPLRRQLKALQAAAETSTSDICAQREGLTEVPSWKRFFMFDANTALAKLRADAMQRKASEEKTRVEAEMKEAKEPLTKKKSGEDKEAKEKPKSKRAKKREKQKEKKMAEDEEAAKLNAKEVKEPVSLGNLKTDLVEEMDFSDGSED